MSDPRTTLVVANKNEAESDPAAATPNEAESKRKGGAQPQNKNATKHGLRSSGLPKGCSYLQSQLTSFRHEIRSELVALHCGKPTTTYEETVMQSAVRHETRALLAARWLRKEGTKLKIEQRTALLREIGNATDSRDRCLKLLKLDRDPRQAALDAWYDDCSSDAVTP